MSHFGLETVSQGIMDKVRAGRASRSSLVYICCRDGLFSTREGNMQQPLAEGDQNRSRLLLDLTMIFRACLAFDSIWFLPSLEDGDQHHRGGIFPC